MRTIRLASDLLFDSVVDGLGIRSVIWTQGCPHNCFGCHNPGTHDSSGGKEYQIDDIIKRLIKENKNVTFSGGDPFFQPKECTLIAKELKNNKLNLWAYTGWTFEELLKRGETEPSIIDFLSYLDRLVDGPFIMAKRNLDIPFRGSTNQRIIIVPESLKSKTAIIDTSIYGDIEHNKPSGIFI